jgi:membrane protein YdbS with pleckstrin-like domain
MKSKVFEPNPNYLKKLRTIVTAIAIIVLFFFAILAWPIGADQGFGGAMIYLWIIGAIIAAGWLFGMSLTGPYYRSLRYEIHDDEVIVHVGIVTKSVKHVPFRTVTNITIKRGILDRWFFGLGTLNIQTAGMSGNQGAEESLEGLPNVQEVYDIVVTELRRFRGSMAPTAADVEGETAAAAPPSSNGTLKLLLAEVQSIRLALEKGLESD